MLTDAQIAAWLWMLAHGEWCTFTADANAYVERPTAENAPLLSKDQLGAMDRACEELHGLGWVERLRVDGSRWWYRADRRRADHLDRTWALARALLDRV